MTLLALTHISTRLPGREIRGRGARGVPDTVLPRDFDSIDVPLPERGHDARASPHRAARPAA